MNPLEIGLRGMVACIFCMALSGCAGAIVGTAADLVIETAKVPFKVAGAVVDVVVPDSEER